MARSYTLKKRAEQQAETRERLVEAAVHLHTTVGPARTTLSMVAEKAGVQRHTLYAHFPDEQALLMACSGHVEERDPLPGAEAWRGIKDTNARLSAGLTAVYGWYARNAQLLSCVLRDAEYYAPVTEIAALRFGPHFKIYQEVLGAKLNARQRALLHLALSFHTWRSLVQEAGLKQAVAVETMADLVTG
ncbi:hypothetical protein BH10PSE10_BH10PSE10_18260 [soil metagenome]